MNTDFAPYDAADARTDAEQLRAATDADWLSATTADADADLVYEVRNRLAATEGVRHTGPDIDYIDAFEALVIADQLIKDGELSDFNRLADEMDAAAQALDDLITNTKPKRTREKKVAQTPAPTRTANQIWKHDGGSK